MINTLMIFAAGFGTRLLPLTKDTPKPLLRIAGQSLLEYTLDLASHFPFERIVINTHYLSEQIVAAVEEYKIKAKPDAQIIIIHENKILETGGAIKNAMNLLGANEQIFTLNSDSIISCDSNIWQSMIENWNALEMDFMLLLTPVKKCFGTTGRGDFDINSDGSLHRDNNVREFMFSGLQILKPDFIAQYPYDTFSLGHFYKNNNARLAGYINQVHFYHISNIADYNKALTGF